MEGQRPRRVTIDEVSGFFLDVPDEVSPEDIAYRLRLLEELGIAKDKVFLNYMEVIAEYARAEKEKPVPVPNRADRRREARLTRRKK